MNWCPVYSGATDNAVTYALTCVVANDGIYTTIGIIVIIILLFGSFTQVEHLNVVCDYCKVCNQAFTTHDLTMKFPSKLSMNHSIRI